MAKEGSGRCKAQTEKYHSTTLKRDQKYGYLQFMAAPRTVYKYAQNAMQDRGQKRLKHKEYKTFIKQPKNLNET